MSIQALSDFLEPISIAAIMQDEGFKDNQLGRHVPMYEESIPDIQSADLVIIGCREMRGSGVNESVSHAADAVRKELYQLYHWHSDIQLVDLGNVRSGATLHDSYAAMRTVVKELVAAGKKVLIVGGSHDNTLAQYQAYGSLNKIIDATVIDAKINLDMEGVIPEDIFLVEMFTGLPNHLRHYTHIGFQSYFMHPDMLEMIDKLRFDCFRVGKVKEAIELMEPPIRNSHMVSFDITAIQHAHAPANHITPNGFNGEEACTLMQYAGMSQHCSSIGLYGFNPNWDVHSMTAKQLAQMIWYLMDGIRQGKQEAAITNSNEFNHFNMAFAEVTTTFLQSKRTGRWWMQINEQQYVACSYRDYQLASNNEIPEAWLRAIERS